jgi:hypothetical protein
VILVQEEMGNASPGHVILAIREQTANSKNGDVAAACLR